MLIRIHRSLPVVAAFETIQDDFVGLILPVKALVLADTIIVNFEGYRQITLPSGERVIIKKILSKDKILCENGREEVRLNPPITRYHVPLFFVLHELEAQGKNKAVSILRKHFMRMRAIWNNPGIGEDEVRFIIPFEICEPFEPH